MDSIIARRLQNTLGQNVTTYDMTVDGVDYILTDGTGDGLFAYEASAVEEWLDDDESGNDYESFCSACDPVEDLRVAVEAYRDTKFLLCRGGVCSHILSERDREIIDAVLDR